MDPIIEARFTNTARSKTFQNICRTYNLDVKAVLDIGCSYGEFVANFGAGSVGVTIDPEEAAYGRRRGLDLREGNIESDSFVLQETFDVVFANNIFEHLYSPHQFLVTVKQYLKPSGVLILGVPCMPVLRPLMRFKKFRGALAVSHINFFARDTLVETVQRAGWVVHTTRGFHFSTALIDHLLDPIYPHFYVVATPDTDFAYHYKRLKELAGYDSVSKTGR